MIPPTQVQDEQKRALIFESGVGYNIPIVSIVLPLWGLPFTGRTLNIQLVKPNQGTTMETIGTVWVYDGSPKAE